MKIDLSTVLLLGVAGFVAYRLTRADLPNATEGATSLFWGSSLGDLTTKGVEAWGSTWGKPFDPYSAEEAAEIARVADNLNKQVGYHAGSWGTL